ncbi:MAG: MerR family transcriptional regulator [Bacteroidales bacterium]|nr:MerR family transcriptional regulator [Bacteroidales bacterium]
MTNSGDNSEKMYYTIGEVAEMFNLNTSNIRFWEKEFDVIKPRRNKKGNRYFTAKDVENFHLIYHLLKERGYTLKGAKEKLKKDHDSAEKASEISVRLKKIRSFLVDLKQQLD